jgi:hypothetical protein
MNMEKAMKISETVNRINRHVLGDRLTDYIMRIVREYGDDIEFISQKDMPSLLPKWSYPFRLETPEPDQKTLSDFLPPRIIQMAFEGHVRIRVVPSIKGQAAGYDLQNDEILFSASASIDRKGLAQTLTRQMGTAVEPEACFVALFFHERGHWEKRKMLARIENCKSLGEARSFREEAEREARDYGRRRFWDWKFSPADQEDYDLWKRSFHF